VFVQALRGGGVKRAVSGRAYLFGIARHVGLSAARRERAVERLGERLGEVAAPVEREGGDVERMRGAMAELPGQVRETLELRLREELTYEEIAGVLGVPVGTVRSRLHTAVKMLSERMKRE
jgi:RNA polymerase sigma-70 factor (ECF subfamily)